MIHETKIKQISRDQVEIRYVLWVLLKSERKKNRM